MAWASSTRCGTVGVGQRFSRARRNGISCGEVEQNEEFYIMKFYVYSAIRVCAIEFSLLQSFCTVEAYIHIERI